MVKINVKPIAEHSLATKPQDLKVPGWMFGWRNKDIIERHGWKGWAPVERDTELGAEVAKQLGIDVLSDSTNFFLNGIDGVLGYTSVKWYEDQRKADASAADKALSVLGDDAKITRHVVIDDGPQS